MEPERLGAKTFGPRCRQNQFLRPEHSRAQCLGEFHMGYDLVKVPLGEGRLEATWRSVPKRESPVVASQFAVPRIRRVAAWCRELQLVSGEEPFFLLSVRTVGAKLGLGNPRRGRPSCIGWFILEY